MIKISTFILLSFCFLDLWSQSDFRVYDDYSIGEPGNSFQMGHLIRSEFEIMNDGMGKLFYENAGTTKESMVKTEPVNMVIRILDQEGRITQDIEIDHNDVDIDLSGFQIHYPGHRPFLIFTAGRYRFYILNLSTNRVTGPIIPRLEGDASDSQDGTLSFSEVFDQGQYLIGYAKNLGMFCYNLTDLDNPIFVRHICPDKQHLHNNYFFLDKRRDNTYNGLFIKNHRNGKYDSARFIFKGKVLLKNEDGSANVVVLNERVVQIMEILENNQVDSLTFDLLPDSKNE